MAETTTAMPAIKRVTLNGGIQSAEFEHWGGRFLVKNFSDADLLVAFDAAVTEAESIKIGANMGQLVVINERAGMRGQEKAKKIYFKGAGTGEVEVQQLWF